MSPRYMVVRRVLGLKVTTVRPRYLRRPGVHLAYGPGAVLKVDAHWRNWRAWNGIQIGVGDWMMWVEVRG